MKRIGIVTHYAVHNHGAQLQLYALIQVLKAQGFHASALQFTKDYRYMEKGAAEKYSISIKSIPFYIKYSFSKGWRKTLFNVKKKFLFDSFRKKNRILGKWLSSFDGDTVIVGSDEVFSVETGLTDAFWGNEGQVKNYISYAASFGPTTMMEIKEKNLEGYLQKALNNFSSIAVRDKNSKDIIEKLTKIPVELTCDPVILYGYQQEITSCKRKVKVEYILLYSYDNNMNLPEEIQLVKEVARTFNLPVYSVGFYHSWCDRNINASPTELLAYFKHASYVITDTFHGTVISLITNARFGTMLRGNANKLYNLLAEYNLEDRIFSSQQECVRVLQSDIDYSIVENKMESYRKKSLDYLLNALKN